MNVRPTPLHLGLVVLLLTACGGAQKAGPKTAPSAPGLDTPLRMAELPPPPAVCPATPASVRQDSLTPEQLREVYVPGEPILRGTWDFIVMFRGQPFSGTLFFPAGAQDASGHAVQGATGRVVLPGHFEGEITVASINPQCGAVVLQIETPRGSAAFKAQYERRHLIAGVLENVLVGPAVTGIQRSRITDTDIVMSATRR